MTKYCEVACLAVIVVAGFIPDAMADKLPKSAQPMSTADVSAMYSGKTADWGSARAYFAPDGSVIGYNSKEKGTFKGSWSVSSNRNCMKIRWKSTKTGESGNSTDCWDWFRDGKKIWTLWSTHYDGSQPKKDDYYQGEVKKLKAGDRVSKQYAKLTGG